MMLIVRPMAAGRFGLLLLSIHYASALGLVESVHLAVDYSLQRKADQFNIQADQDFALAAGSLPDPRVYTGVSNIPISSMPGTSALSTGQDSMSMGVLGISQDLPNRERRAAAHNKSLAVADQQQALAEQTISIIRIKTAQTWVDRYYAKQRMAILEVQERDSELLIALVEQEVRGGRRPPADAVDARLALADVRNQWEQAHAQHQIRIEQLCRWLGENGRKPLTGSIPHWPIQPQELLSHLHYHPDLMVANASIQVAQSDVQEAEAERKPDWGVDLAYEHRGPAYADMVSLSLTMSLPVFQQTRQGPRIRSAQEHLEQARDQLLDMQREHQAAINADISNWLGITAQIVRLEHESEPLAQEKTILVLSQYQQGTVNMDQVLASRQQLRQLQLTRIALQNQRDDLEMQLHYEYTHGETMP